VDFLMRAEKVAEFLETIWIVFYAIILSIVFRTLAYEPFNIPSSSMEPTLLVGDYLFVSKLSYGYSRYSFPFGLRLTPGRVLFTPPERGDVAVFKLPRDNETDYIKRIIGLPGDRIQVTEGRLYINDEMVERKRIGEYLIRNNRGDFRSIPLYLETLPNGRSHRIIEISDEMILDNTDEFLVPEGHYFAMGDNRDNSMDSRVLAGVGFVPELNLVGRAERLFFSQDGSARVWQLWKWPLAIRYGRLFQEIT
jgi:signal peptidase I